jgi:mRNA-degrading endonuclease toxin of MazEF toxin-antitoxin module
MKADSLSEGRRKDMAKRNNVVKRGDLVYAALGNYPGSHKQSGDRPCLVVSNDHNNIVSPIVTVCPLTTRIRRNPMHISIGEANVQGYFLKESEIMVEQLTVLDRKSIISKYGYVKKELMDEVDMMLQKHLGFFRQEESEAGDLP